MVLSISPKASAALSRRCLQAVLRAHGYKTKDLAKEIDLLLHETDPTKAIPQSLRTVVDAVRNFGNFSAHPITDVTTLQIIDVQPEEAEWCLEVLDECFEHFYVRPARAAARKAALDAKLSQAGNLLRNEFAAPATSVAGAITRVHLSTLAVNHRMNSTSDPRGPR
ncbi:DUF4145 domain-containing protein [Sinorhizobium medicae]